MGLRRSGKEQVGGWTFWSGLRCENTCVPHACSAGAPADRRRRPIPRVSTNCSPAHTVHGQSASSSARVSPHGLDDLHLSNHACCHAFRYVSQQLRPTRSRAAHPRDQPALRWHVDSNGPHCSQDLPGDSFLSSPPGFYQECHPETYRVLSSLSH